MTVPFYNINAMGKKFNYCATESSYADAKSSGEFTDTDLAFIKGDTNKGIIKTRGMTVGTREVEFAGVFKYGEDYIEDSTSLPSNSKLYFLEALGVFGYGTVSQFTNINSPTVLFQFKGWVTNIKSPSIVNAVKDSCKVEDVGVLSPLDHATYVIGSRDGIKYSVYPDGTTEWGTTKWRMKPLFELRAGDCMLNDGTFCLKQDAVENHLDDIMGIIVDPVRKTLILNNGVPQVMRSGWFGGASASDTIIKPVRNVLASVDNCTDYARIFENLFYAFRNISEFGSYFPVFYTAAYNNYTRKMNRWYLATEYEKKFIKENADIQDVLAAIDNTSYPLSYFSAQPRFEHNDSAATYMLDKVVQGTAMPLYASSGSVTSYYNVLSVYV